VLAFLLVCACSSTKGTGFEAAATTTTATTSTVTTTVPVVPPTTTRTTTTQQWASMMIGQRDIAGFATKAAPCYRSPRTSACDPAAVISTFAVASAAGFIVRDIDALRVQGNPPTELFELIERTRSDAQAVQISAKAVADCGAAPAQCSELLAAGQLQALLGDFDRWHPYGV
jgi:hypothetical protein